MSRQLFEPCRLTFELRARGKTKGMRGWPHILLMNMATAESEECLRALRELAETSSFDAEVSDVLGTSSVMDYREHIVAACFVLFRPRLAVLDDALRARLFEPPFCSPQLTCIAAVRGILAQFPELGEQLATKLHTEMDDNARARLQKALGALDASQEGLSRFQYLAAQQDSVYPTGVKVYEGWCPSLRSALNKLEQERA